MLPVIRGKLKVSGLETVEPSDFTPSEAYLKDRTRIVELELCWNGDSDNIVVCDEKLAEEVLECLRPHPNIKVFNLFGYPGTALPMWLGSLSKLEELRLHCPNITSLPTLGQLPNLKSLNIIVMERVKYIGRELLVSGTQGVKRSSFPSLEYFYFNDNSELEEWHGVEAGDFPCLHKLCFQGCPKLRIIPLLPSVTSLRFCVEWNHEVLLGDNLPMLRDLSISDLNVDSLVFPASQIVRSVEKLSISYCKEVRSLSGLGNFTSLRHLVIHKCRHLQISPDERLPLNLQDVEIHQSPYAKRWYQHQVCDHQVKADVVLLLAVEPANCNNKDVKLILYAFFTLWMQMDLESQDDDDAYGVEAMSMNSESEQDEVNYDIEANI